MTAPEALLLMVCGLGMALYHGAALLIVVADLALPPRLVEAMGGHPPYRGVRRWVTAMYLAPMTVFGTLVLLLPIVGAPQAEPDSALTWLIVAAAWGAFIAAMVGAVLLGRAR